MVTLKIALFFFSKRCRKRLLFIRVDGLTRFFTDEVRLSHHVASVPVSYYAVR